MSHEHVIILGSGPAGLTAALYAARANLRPLIFDGLLMGGQLTQTTDVDNYPGFAEGIMGPDLMDAMRSQVERFGARFELDEIVSCDLSKRPFTVVASGGNTFTCDALIIATGATAKRLNIESETRLWSRGVSACATCDGFFFKGVELIVVGGGDTAMEEATFLTKFATKVYIVHRRDALRASKIMQDRAMKNPKIEFIWSAEIVEILGDQKCDAVRLRNTVTGETWVKPIGGVFLGIGHEPNTRAFVDWIDHDADGYLVTTPGRTATNIPGVYACGDVQDHYYRQAVTAAGSGCQAAIECERWLEAQHG